MNSQNSSRAAPDTRIMFMGSPQYAATILKVLHEHQYKIAAVISQPDKGVGRGKNLQSPDVKLLADKLGLKTYQPASIYTPAFDEILTTIDPELIVVAAYGKILREKVLTYPIFGCVNVHASLLPRWRGASPINAAIQHGDASTGVTIMKMDAGIDTGDIISMREKKLDQDETAASLTEDLAVIGGGLLVDTLPEYLAGKITLQKQDNSCASYAGMIKKTDGLIDFNKPAVEIDRMVRAYDPWPNAYFEWEGKNIKVFKVDELATSQFAPGSRGVVDKYPCVGTGTFDLRLVELQLPGKKRINGKIFMNGARNWQS